MAVNQPHFSILIVEDNPGDMTLVVEYLIDEFKNPKIFKATTYAEAKKQFNQNESFSSVLLDLSLPDNSGENLVKDILYLANDTPVIVLTGFADKAFSVKTLSMGIADYLVKDELNGSLLYKGITYSIERKKALKTLKESEEKYRNIFNHSLQPMLVYDVESKKILNANKAAIEKYQYSLEEFIQLSIYDLRPDSEIDSQQQIEEESLSNHFYTGIFKHKKKNGKIIYTQVLSNEVTFEGRRANLLCSTDISEKIKNEELILSTNKRLKAASEIGKIGYWEYDIETDKLYWSDEVYRIFEVDKKTPLTNKFYNKLIHPDDVEFVKSYQEKSIKGVPGLEIEHRIKTPSGKIKFVYQKGQMHFDFFKNPKKFEGIIQDVSERYLYEEKLRKQEIFYRALIEKSPDMKTLIKPDGNIIYGTPSITNILGYSSEELIGKNERDVVHPDDVDNLFEKINQTINTGKVFSQIQVRVRHKNGHYLWCDKTITNMLNQPEINAIVCNFWDVTEKKLTELKAENSANLIKRLTDEIPIAIYQFEMEANGEMSFPFMSYGFQQLLNVLDVELLKTDALAAFANINQEDLPGFLDSILQSRENLTIWSYDFRIADDENKYRWIKGISRPEKMPNGKVIWYGYLEDITEQKLFDKKLKESNNRYQIVAKATNDIIWDLNFKDNTLTWNENLEVVFGYHYPDLTTPLAWWEEKIHKSDKKRILNSLNETINNKETFWTEIYRFRDVENNYRFVYDRGYIIYDDAQNPVNMIGAIQDITKQKLREDHLKLLESVITNTYDAVIITKAEPINEPGPEIVFVNDSFCKMSGYSKTELIGKTPRILQGPKTSAESIKYMRQSMENWQPYDLELINYKKNGEEFWVHISVFPLADEKGWFTHWIAIERDITQRKAQEFEREQLVKELTQNNKDLKEFSYITSHNLRAPLTNLIGLTNLLDYYKINDPELKEIIDGLKISTKLLDQTILDLGKIVTIKDSPAMQKQKLNIQEVFKNVCHQVQLSINELNPTINVNFNKAPTVVFNKSYLESILQNLLTNSIKYYSPKRPLVINLSTYTDGKNTVLKFSDNGIGLEIDLIRNKIFGMYQRFHNLPNSKGLGLFLVKSQMEALGGTIEVDSKVDVGTTFTLKFKA